MGKITIPFVDTITSVPLGAKTSMPLWVIEVPHGYAQNDFSFQLFVVAFLTGIIMFCGSRKPIPMMTNGTQNHFRLLLLRTKKAMDINRAYQNRLVVFVIIETQYKKSIR
jgi:hypothetical protein